MDIKQFIRTIPDYPKPGIMFRDITTLLGSPEGFTMAVDGLIQLHKGATFDVVAGIEARGFILGGAVAHRLKLGFVPVRKKGKLPWKTHQQEYDLEYGTDIVEVHCDAIQQGQRVLLIDDLIATGGTAAAAIKLVETCGGIVTAASFVIDLPELGGRDKLQAMDIEVLSLCSFEGH